jgi:4-amino-4-deoxy-L-arabinose transferase-like glycosyltransferase
MLAGMTTTLAAQTAHETDRAVPAAAAPRRPLVNRVFRGSPDDPAWARPGLLVLLAATAVLYLWGLGASGWANSFYSAAVQAGSASWKAFFFGSSDAANSITVDKTPASLWVMALSARLFGVNAWSILVPQAIEGVAAVGLLYATVRRWSGPTAGLVAGAVLAVTPVAVLMFRFNNPDALLVLLLIAGAYATLRAVEAASPRWLMFAAGLVGFGFLTKMLQALLVVPAFAIVYLVAAPTTLRRRFLALLAAGAALIVTAGWWVAIVELIPASARPYIGGSQHNSILELTLGYNGFGRLTGNEVGSVSMGNMWGATGWTRLFTSDIGGQIAWLLPAALVLLAAGHWVMRRAPRIDMTRATLLLWGLWLLVTGLIFSFMRGVFHAYYTVALAPAVAAIIGIGVTLFWQRRRDVVARSVLAATLAVTAIWAHVLLVRSTDFVPWLAVAVPIAGIGLAVLLLGATWLPRRAALAVAVAGLVTALAGPSAYAVETAATAHSGSIVTAGPTVASAGSGGGFGGRGAGAGPGGGGGPFGTGPQTGTGQVPGGAAGGFGGQAGGGGPAGRGGVGGGGAGGLLRGSSPSAALVTLLQADARSYTWVAASVGSNNASGYQLATGDPVMALGGFNGSDPSPTLAQFQHLVSEGKIHYFIGGGVGMPSSGGSSASQLIASWVAANFTATTVGNATVYDLTGATTTGATTTGATTTGSATSTT